MYRCNTRMLIAIRRINEIEISNTSQQRKSANIQSATNNQQDAQTNLWKYQRSRAQLRTYEQIAYYQQQCQACTFYACVNWKVTHNIRNKLQALVNKCLRTINRIFWPNSITNEQLLNISSCQPITHTYIFGATPVYRVRHSYCFL